MMSPERQTQLRKDGIDSSRLDFSLLVGHELTLFSDQFPGKSLKSKVILAKEREITIDRGGSSGQVDSLVNNQQVTIQVVYKGQKLSLPATLKRSGAGRCKMILGDRVVPLRRRRFVRVAMGRSVKLAVVPVATFNAQKLARLRWLETTTTNVSAGGVLIDFSSYLESPTYLFLSLDLNEFSFPGLIVGQVQYSLSATTGHFLVGIEFIVEEEGRERFTRTILKQFPRSVFQYNKAQRSELNTKLTELRLDTWQRE
jgi:hypothetical protein